MGLEVGQDVWLIIKTYSCHLLLPRATDLGLALHQADEYRR